MHHRLRILLALAALLAVVLAGPTSAECKVRGAVPKAASAFTPAPEAAAAGSAANATSTSDVGADAESSPSGGNSKNKIQHAPKKRMKNKILFDVTKPKTSGKSTSNNSPASGIAITTSQQSASN